MDAGRMTDIRGEKADLALQTSLLLTYFSLRAVSDGCERGTFGEQPSAGFMRCEVNLYSPAFPETEEFF